MNEPDHLTARSIPIAFSNGHIDPLSLRIARGRMGRRGHGNISLWVSQRVKPLNTINSMGEIQNIIARQYGGGSYLPFAYHSVPISNPYSLSYSLKWFEIGILCAETQLVETVYAEYV